MTMSYVLVEPRSYKELFSSKKTLLLALPERGFHLTSLDMLLSMNLSAPFERLWEYAKGQHSTSAVKDGEIVLVVTNGYTS